MSKMSKSNIGIFASVASSALEIFRAAGETKFEELGKSKRNAIASAFAKVETDFWEGDGDSDESYIIWSNDNDDVIVVSSSSVDSAWEVTGAAEEIRVDAEVNGEYDQYQLTTDVLEWIIAQGSVETTVVNLTPHAINIVNDAGEVTHTFPAAGTMVRVNSEDLLQESVAGVEVVKTKYTSVDGLPDRQPNTIYLVSVLVAQALRGSRPDVYTPDMGPKSVVRDDDGQIVGVKRFMQV